jgi:hypothetical protein
MPPLGPVGQEEGQRFFSLSRRLKKIITYQPFSLLTVSLFAKIFRRFSPSLLASDL